MMQLIFGGGADEEQLRAGLKVPSKPHVPGRQSLRCRDWWYGQGVSSMSQPGDKSLGPWAEASGAGSWSVCEALLVSFFQAR